MKGITILLLMIFASHLVYSQNERKVIREGVKAYEKGDYSEAEVQFRKAEDLNQGSFEAEFNTGAALYGQEKYQETVKQYESMVQGGSDPEKLSKIWHNMGNSLLEAQQYQASIEAYKNSLRLNPSDLDTKYNLAYARKKLQEQQQQQNQDKNQQQNQDKNQQQNQDKNQQQNQQDQDQQAQDQPQQEQQNQDQQARNQQDQAQQDQQLASAQEISKEDAERMLSAIQQQEKDVKEKVDKQKAAVAKVKTEKDW
jgi:Ca-activated chloride channel family protein